MKLTNDEIYRAYKHNDEEILSKCSLKRLSKVLKVCGFQIVEVLDTDLDTKFFSYIPETDTFENIDRGY